MQTGCRSPVRSKPGSSREITRPLESHVTPVQVQLPILWEPQSERLLLPWTLDLKESSALRSTTAGSIAETWLELKTATVMVRRARSMAICGECKDELNTVVSMSFALEMEILGLVACSCEETLRPCDLNREGGSACKPMLF